MAKMKALGCWLTALSMILMVHTVQASDQLYGDELSNALSIRIADLTANPEQYIDQRVKIEGLVDDICPMKGCWVDILEAESRETIRFKVQDDVIVFPVEARGHQIVAEGILRKLDLSKKQAIRRLRHFADEKGEDFDESSVTGPTVFYEIEGAGAILTN